MSETLALSKIINIMISGIIIIGVYFIQRYTFKKQSKDYKEFTNEIKAESREREKELVKVIGKNQDIIFDLSNKLDIVEEVKKDVNSVKEIVSVFVKENEDK